MNGFGHRGAHRQQHPVVVGGVRPLGIIEANRAASLRPYAVEDALQLRGDLGHEPAANRDDAVSRTAEGHASPKRGVALGGLRPIGVESDGPHLCLKLQQIGRCRGRGIRAFAASFGGEDLVREQHLVARQPIAHRQQRTADRKDAVDTHLALEHRRAQRRQTSRTRAPTDRIPLDGNSLLRLLEFRGGGRGASREPLHELVEIVTAEAGRQALVARQRLRSVGEFGDAIHERALYEPEDVSDQRDRIGKLRVRCGVERGIGEQRPHVVRDALLQVCEGLDGAAHDSILVTPSDIRTPDQAAKAGLWTSGITHPSGLSWGGADEAAQRGLDSRSRRTPTMIA